MLELDSAVQTRSEVSTSAAREAARNWQGNLAALAQTQHDLAASLALSNPQVEWLFARDGALTAFENGKWWGGCSVPQKAAEELLRTLNITCSIACFLCPAHASQITFTLSQLKPEQAIIAIIPRLDDLILTLHSHDYASEISAHRLWFIAGEKWPQQMTDLFHKVPGLPLPQQFIRTALLHEDPSAPLIAAAQKIFTDELNRRSELLARLRQTPSRRNLQRKRITLAAPMNFRLWDDGGGVLRKVVAGDEAFDWTVINFDDPAYAAPLALAQAAAESDAIMTVNLTRADCGQFIHPQAPLISWLTTRPIPPFDSSFARDMLLLTTGRAIEAAKRAGWPADRLALLPWPAIAAPSGSTLAIIADTRRVDPSPVFDLSSHQLLWDLIHSDLQSPAPIYDIQAYLKLHMQRLNVADHGLEHRRFIEELIVPAYQQSVAAALLKANIPLKLFGHGWRDIPTFAPYAAGLTSSHEELKRAIATSAGLIQAWPSDHPHPIDTAGPPVIRLTCGGVSGLISQARLAVQGKLIKPASPAADSFDMAALARIVRAALAD